ncbi:hypothetical protein G7054_g2984 [Neopestalotiopsis clavispora]|nr:hypothetical protein G7054_g2984 [Neopestalotiopsis clavispora]
MAATTPLPYELYSDAPGILFNKPEWDAANAAHPRGTDFGSVPKGWPTELKGPQVWTGSYLSQNRRRHTHNDYDLARTDAWTADLYIRKITSEEVAEVDAAIQFWKHLELPLSDLNRERFPLPTFGRVLEDVAKNIYHGVGLQVLRGFPIQSHSKEDQIIAFLGINSWIGDERLNQGADRGLCHIKSISHIDPVNRGKIYVSAQDTNAQMYHSDAGGEVVSLMAVSLSGTGGASTVLPDRDSRYPALTLEEREAFGGWQWVADQYSLETEFEVGDIEWVNNLHLQHARRGFTEDVAQPRHLLRVWLRNAELSPPHLPLDMKRKFDAMFGQAPTFYPRDEIEEDERRRATGIFTGSCKTEDAKDRLAQGK